MKALNTATATRITAAVSASSKADKSMVSAIDTLIAEGFKSTDFISPKTKDTKSTASEELFEAINAAIIKGFPAPTQALLIKNTKSLSDSQKASKRYAQQQIGAKRNDFKSAMEKRNKKEIEGSTSRTRTPDQRIRDSLNDILKVCAGLEEPKFDIIKMRAQVLAAIKLL